MFKNHKIELRLTKDRKDATEESTPSITKEDAIHIAKNVVKYVVGGVLLTLAASAVLDTARYDAMVRIDNRHKELED